MISRIVDRAIEAIAPSWAVERAKSRAKLAVSRGYQGAEPSRLNVNRNARNNAADQELLGPYGADMLRANARQLVRDNSYAWGVVDTIVSSVIGTGIKTLSSYETQDGEDVEHVNELRDNLWERWCENCEITGNLTWEEVQALAMREVVEAGECLIHFVTVPLEFHGIKRPIPLAVELIEADRLASDKDTYAISRRMGKRIVRGVEFDEIGVVTAYWIYPYHPTQPNVFQREPIRIDAGNVRHLFRRDRIGQSRGVTWLAPAICWMRDLGLFVDNEMQAGAVAACFTAAIKSEMPIDPLPPSTGGETTSESGQQYDYMEPGLIFRLKPGEDVSAINPTRPNSGAEPWIALMLRGIAVGTGLSYEIVARDFSQTNYSSNRASQLEDRRRFRCWQKLIINDLCKFGWEKFCDHAALIGSVGFPSAALLEEDRKRYAPAVFMPPSWEWVDPVTEQAASQASITAFQSTYEEELGARSKNWRYVFYQRKKEEKLLRELGLVSPSQAVAAQAAGAEAQMVQAQAIAQEKTGQPATGEMMGLSTLQFNRNRKAIDKVLTDFASGAISETKARVFLGGIGMAQTSIDALIADAADGTVDELPEVATDA